ncbi:hypothetical protein KC349_g224 [Hortaea werneckii]|nr:hypothetical protein KC349_g224 [Hortaea werneckii]
METIHADDTPLAAYLEGDGYLDRSFDDDDLEPDALPSPSEGHHEPPSFAPLNSHVPSKARRARQSLLPQLEKDPTVPQSMLSRIHTTWSIALNSRLSRADNAKFIEHFRYVIVASQLLNEYLDHGSLPRRQDELIWSVCGSSMCIRTGLLDTLGKKRAHFYAVMRLRQSPTLPVTGKPSKSQAALPLASFRKSSWSRKGSDSAHLSRRLRALRDKAPLEDVGGRGRRFTEHFSQDAKEASGDNSLSVLEDDAESLKSLRVLSYRMGVLRRVTLCSLMSLEADGGKPDFYRWRVTIEAMQTISNILAPSARRLQQILNEMETISVPQTPIRNGHGASREKMRSQVRKISTLSSGIRGLQAKMQILREETNRSIGQQEDLTDLGPSLMAQYESIGTDLRELMQAWESGKTSLQSNITKQERRISMASSGLRSPVSSIGGLTAVDEDGTPDDALKALNGGSRSSRSSLGTTPSDEEQVFEALAVPRQRSTLTREERIVKMQEERERQATLRAKRESNTNMLRELESVINLRPGPGKTGSSRIMSM